MTIFYTRVQRPNPFDRNQPPKWYLTATSQGTVRLTELAKLMADETTQNPKEIELALSLFVKVLNRSLLDGKTVNIDDFGIFRTTITSEGAETEDKALPGKAKSKNIKFSPAPLMKESIAKAPLQLKP